MARLLIGTCSWKYPSWNRIVYSRPKYINYLEEYARKYNTVEIDQWFWSLFGPDSIKLPDPGTVSDYLASVPSNFRFTVKVPNSISLSHYYKKKGEKDITPNPHFLSPDLFEQFLDRLEPLSANIEALIFQFEYLNKKKMRSQGDFLSKLSAFFDRVPWKYRYAIETRNNNYLNEQYFAYLSQSGLFHVFSEGYYLPHIFDLYNKFGAYINDFSIIRLLGFDREGIEEQSGKKWDEIIDPKDDINTEIAKMTKDLLKRGVEVVMNVNNHWEGSAPLSIDRLSRLISQPYSQIGIPG